MKNGAESNSNSPSWGPMLLALFLLAIGAALWTSDQKSQSLSSHRPAQEPPVLDQKTILEKVNRHMQWADSQVELNALATEIENFETGRVLKPGDLGTPPAVPQPPLNNFDSENTAGRVYRDLYPNAGQYDRPVLPGDRVNSMIEQEQWLKQYDQAQQRAFIDAVINNARAAGYELVINDQLQVVRIQRRPNNATPTGAR